jgi:hypothetical protein
MPNSNTTRAGERGLRLLLSAIAALGLAIDAYIHLDLASNYDAIRTSTLSQGDLFRIEGGAAVLAAVAVLLRPRRYTALFAFVVAAAGITAVLIYRYVDIKGFGPIPSMYEPVWYTEKTRSAYAEGAATLASAALLGMFQLSKRRLPKDARGAGGAMAPSRHRPSPSTTPE